MARHVALGLPPPPQAVQMARRLALEWQAYVVRASALRRVFVSVKGYYFQAEIAGQSVTWLTPHVLSQVLPADVDFRVMITFLDFYNTLLEFINFKLYHTLGVSEHAGRCSTPAVANAPPHHAWRAWPVWMTINQRC